MDLLSLAKEFGLPVLGAVAGFVTTSYAVRTKVNALEKNLTTTKKGWKLELEMFKGDLATKHRELKEELEKKYKELKEQLDEIEDNLNRWQRESSHSFASDEELTRFVEDQQKQWQAIQRTLGKIEGMLKMLP